MRETMKMTIAGTALVVGGFCSGIQYESREFERVQVSLSTEIANLEYKLGQQKEAYRVSTPQGEFVLTPEGTVELYNVSVIREVPLSVYQEIKKNNRGMKNE